MDLGAGEAGEAGDLALHNRLDGVGARGAAGALGQVERAAHEGPTPTWTFRNRAGEAP